MTVLAPANVIVDDLLVMTRLFTEIAMGPGIAAVLLAVGAILFAVSMGVFGGLTLGAVADLLTPN